MGAETGPFAAHPDGQLVRRQRSDVVVAPETVVVEPAQPTPVLLLAPAARHHAGLRARQRVCLGDEVLQRHGTRSPPGALVTKTQTAAQQLAPAVDDGACAPGDRAPLASAFLDAIFGHRVLRPFPPACIAAAVVAVRRGHTTRRAAPPRRGPVTVHITGEQPQRLVPLAATPPVIDTAHKPPQPGGVGIDTAAFVEMAGDEAQRWRAHLQRCPPATASTARRRSSSRACRYTVVDASDTCPNSFWTTSTSTPARTQFVAALWRSM